MHPSDQHHEHQHHHQHQYERRRGLYGDEPDEERKSRDRSPDAWGAAVTEPHRVLLPLPLPSAHSIHSIHYDRRRAELFPSEHNTSPPGAGHLFPSPHQRRHDFPLSTVFPTNPLGQERRHHQHFQYHVDTQHRDASPHRRHRHSPAEAKQAATPSRSGKASLAFILDDKGEDEQDDREDDDEADADQHMDTERSLTYLHLNDTSSRDDNDGDSSDTSLERYASYSHSGSERRSPPAAREGARKGSIKKSRICKVENCTRYVVNKGLCIGHGGGKRCAVAGCTSSAKNMGVCWKHGGSTKCTVDNCENRAKSRGVCWSHGGGRKCKEDDCSKTAVSNGLCWAHGGGKRCIVDGCKKPAYERNGNLCTLHKGGTHAPSA